MNGERLLEQEILASFERGEWNPIRNQKSEIARLRAAAKAQSKSAGRGIRTGSEVWYTRDERARDREVLHLPIGVCFINSASTRGTFCVLPRGIFLVPWDSACGRNWLRGKRFPLTARKKSAKGIVGGEPSKARTVPREGSRREEQSIAKELRYCIRRARASMG